MEEPEKEKVEGGRVSINGFCEVCVKELGKSENRWCLCKVKKTFLKRLVDVFSYKSCIKNDCFIDGICWMESWFAVYVDVDLAFFGKERKMYFDDFLKIWPKN